MHTELISTPVVVTLDVYEDQRGWFVADHAQGHLMFCWERSTAVCQEDYRHVPKGAADSRVTVGGTRFENGHVAWRTSDAVNAHNRVFPAMPDDWDNVPLADTLR